MFDSEDQDATVSTKNSGKSYSSWRTPCGSGSSLAVEGHGKSGPARRAKQKGGRGGADSVEMKKSHAAAVHANRESHETQQSLASLATDSGKWLRSYRLHIATSMLPTNHWRSERLKGSYPTAHTSEDCAGTP